MCRVCWRMVCWGAVIIFDSIFVFIYLCIHVSNLLWSLYSSATFDLVVVSIFYLKVVLVTVFICCIHLSISFGLVVFFFYLFVLIAGSTCQLVLVAVSIELVLVAVNICLFYFFGCCIQICLVPHTHPSIILAVVSDLFWLLYWFVFPICSFIRLWRVFSWCIHLFICFGCYIHMLFVFVSESSIFLIVPLLFFCVLLNMSPSFCYFWCVLFLLHLFCSLALLLTIS